jgi:hypothetical protein
MVASYVKLRELLMGNLPFKTQQALEEANWEEIIKRLSAFVVVVINSTEWRGVPGGQVPGGLEPQDIVQQAIQKVLDGVRQWDPDRISLLRCLVGVVSSDINNLARSAENRNSKRAYSRDEDESSITGGIDISQIPADYSPGDVENSLIYSEYAKETEEILAEFTDDQLAYDVVQLILSDDVYRPGALAEILGIEVGDIYNVKKRIKNKLARLLSRLKRS